MPTSCSSATTRSRAADFEMSLWARIASMIWLPTVVHAERGHRFLKNQPDAAAAHRPHGTPLGIERGQILLFGRAGIEQHAARGNAAGPVDQPQDGARGDALAAAAFADHAEHPSGVQIEADAVERANAAGVLDEIHHQVTHRQRMARSVHGFSHKDRPHRAPRRRES
jgi:hypothetical protein